MEKISIQEIAAILIEKSGLRKKDAEQFVLTMFDLIKESLATDRVVKVKGLGTFKVIEIDARESVNVNTGERVLIEGHEKITFTPDNTMKELVNKPFSQFETVVLNDGVTFEDVEEGPEAPEEPEIEIEITTEPVAEPVSVIAQETVEESVMAPVAELASEPELEPEQVVEPEQALLIEEEPATKEAIDEEQIINEEQIEEELYMSKKMTYIALVIAIVACILSFAAGYYFRGNMTSPAATDEVAVENSMSVMPIDTLASDTLTVDSIKNDSLANIEPVKEELVKEDATKAEPVEEEPKTQPMKKEEDAKIINVPDKYEQMDSRVRTGAYRIVGEDHQTKVKGGETLAKIARRTLGPDMECYIEVYNGIKSSAELKEGQTIKIPKLELKKKKKTNK